VCRKIQPHVPAGSAAWSYTSSVSETRASASPSPKPPVLPAFSLLDQKGEVNLTMAATPQSLSGLDRSPQLARQPDLPRRFNFRRETNADVSPRLEAAPVIAMSGAALGLVRLPFLYETPTLSSSTPA